MAIERPPTRLHIGCGSVHLDGWINIDREAMPGVDLVADVCAGLDFADVAAVFAEHFIEHLTLPEGLVFFGEVHRLLAPHGWFRLSTPNLAWVWTVQSDAAAPGAASAENALLANRSFYGWGHRFLWNEALLRAALDATGFQNVSTHNYGESSIDFFRGIEQHERYADADDLPHVIIVEAQKGELRPESLSSFKAWVGDLFLRHLELQNGGNDLTQEARIRELTAVFEAQRRALSAQLSAEHSRRLAAERDWLDASAMLRRVERSPSFRLGRALTAPGRALRGLLRRSQARPTHES